MLALGVAALAASLAGCKNPTQVFQDTGEGGWFSQPVDVFRKPDWASVTSGDASAPLNPTAPVAPAELVSADGRCAPAAPPPGAAAATPLPQSDRPVGSLAGDLARDPMPAVSAYQQPGAPQLMGGVALGMSECEVVRRAGVPGNVNIGGGDHGGRHVVLTYLGGPWPGIYTFDGGRLKVVDRAPNQPEPPQAEPPKPKKTKKAAKPKTASSEIDRVYVQ